MSDPRVPAGPRWAETESHGHPVRHFAVALSVGAMAQAWARQEAAPHGAAVVADQEVSPIGRIGAIWRVPASDTLACAVVLRPVLSVPQGDAAWLMAGLLGAGAAEAVAGRPMAPWWPDAIVDAESSHVVGAVLAEVQLGPGHVRSAVVTLRFDLRGLGLAAEARDELLGAVLEIAGGPRGGQGEGAAGEVAAAYSQVCALMGRRVKVTLRPKGEARGFARRVDESAQMELESSTGMVERVAIDALRNLELA